MGSKKVHKKLNSYDFSSIYLRSSTGKSKLNSDQLIRIDSPLYEIEDEMEQDSIVQMSRKFKIHLSQKKLSANSRRKK